MKGIFAWICAGLMICVCVLHQSVTPAEQTIHAIIVKGFEHHAGITIDEEYDHFILAEIREPLLPYYISEGAVLDLIPAQERRVELLPGINDYEVWFKGPVKPEWVLSLESAGAEVTPLLSPSSKYGYVVIASEPSARLISSLPWVIGVFPYKEKIAGELPSSGSVRVVITFFPGYMNLWGRVIQKHDDTKWGGYIITDIDASMISEVLNHPGVARVERYYPVRVLSDTPVMQPLNDVSRWVIQSFVEGSTPVWDHGIHGEGIIIGCSDTGVDYDHINFRDSMNDMGTPGPNHRKVVKLTNYAGNGEDSMPHGSHVVGTLVGKSLSDPNNYVKYDGMAYNAKVAFMDIFDLDKTQDEIMPSMREMLDDMYAAGARSHSGSWGGYSNQSNGAYSWRSLGADQYMWDHPDFLGVWAAGNSGPGSKTVIEPGTAKNIVTVGSAANGNTRSLASSSSNGPTNDGVRKPTIVAPGVSIVSVSGDRTLGNYNSGYRSMSGTSMATPTAAGGAALVEQYFRDGFYPSGKKDPARGFMPSGPLRKAILINSAWDQFGGSNVDDHIPDNSQGWGKIKLDDALYFEGDARKLWIDDAAYSGGLNTGEMVEYHVTANSGQPLKFTLVYNDYPGNGLKNDLDLRVTSPGNSVYLGNVFDKGESVPGGQPDKSNNDEQVLITSPDQGVWKVEVIATNVPRGPQPYAFVVTGNIINVSKNSSASGPVILSTEPKNKASSVPVTTAISLTFDRPMNTQSAESAFNITPAASGTFSWSSTTMVFKPSTPLAFNTTYSVTESANASDLNGTRMGVDYTFSFRTESMVPVEVLGTMPLNGAKGVDVSSSIKVVFNREVIRSTAEGAFSISPSVSGSFTWPNNYTMVLVPAQALNEMTTYSARINKSVQDLKGNTMLKDYTFSFTTGLGPDTVPPTITIVEPSDGDTLSGIIIVKADAKDNCGVERVDFYLDGVKRSSGMVPPFVWTWNTRDDINGEHTIRAEAVDTGGNTASDDVSVIVSNDFTPPSILHTLPEDKSTGVPVTTSISITFSEEMDHISVQRAFSIHPDITGNFSWEGNTITFTPGISLLSATEYTIRISQEAKDIHGNRILTEYSFSFQTEVKQVSQNEMIYYILPVILLIAVILVALILLKRKRKPERRGESRLRYAQPLPPSFLGNL